MKIEGSKQGRGRPTQVRDDLDEILCSGADGSPVCAPNCPKAGTRVCSRDCPDIPRIISTDPEKHPVEHNIAPLVFELKRLEVFQPCWSCEGHNGPDGKLWKVPRVWFYCSSVVHLRVLASAVSELRVKGHLNVPWQVVLTFSEDDNTNTTFSLEPNLPDEAPPLLALQQDVETIAAHLRTSVLAEVQKLSKLGC